VTGRVITRARPTRLSRSSDVRRVLRDGQRRSGRLMAVHSLPNAQQGDEGGNEGPEAVLGVAPGVAPAVTAGGAPVRLTVVASRRVGNAVRRNRAKRLLREAARTQSWSEGLDVVLVARAACAASGLAEVTAELRTLGARLGLLEDLT
jgi:ribonuclease P protein component